MTIPVARPVSIPVAQPVQVNVTVNTAPTPAAPVRSTPLNPIWGQLLGTAAKAVGTWMTAHAARPPAQHHAPVHHEQQLHDMPIFDDSPTLGGGDWGTPTEMPTQPDNFGFGGFPIADAFGGMSGF
jgi:hypothetical protein